MNNEFATAMRRSLEQTRAGNPADATRLIQEALRGNTSSSSPVDVLTKPTQSRAQQGRRPDDGVEDAELLESTPPRRPFGQVISDLAKRSRGFRSKVDVPTAPLPLPDGARFERRRFESAQGSRDYRLYVPADRSEGIRGLILMLHGCTQTPEDFAAGTAMNTQAERRGFVVAYPEQTRAQNAQLCWNWFRPSDQVASTGEPAILAGLAREVVREFAVPEGRVFVAGLSAGGAMAAILGTTHPDLFGAVGVHSGLAPGSAQDVISAFGAMRGDVGRGTKAVAVPAIVYQGLADATVAPANAARIVGPLTAAETRTDQGSGRRSQVTTGRNSAGRTVELWSIEGSGHAWSGGSAKGSYTDPAGPDASAEMIRFFEAQIDG